MALFSWCHTGVKVEAIGVCLCVWVATKRGMRFCDGSQSLATISHLMYLFYFICTTPRHGRISCYCILHLYFSSLKKTLISTTGVFIRSRGELTESKQKCLSADVYQGHRGCANSHYQRLRHLLSALAALDFYLSWQTKRSLSDTHPLQSLLIKVPLSFFVLPLFWIISSGERWRLCLVVNLDTLACVRWKNEGSYNHLSELDSKYLNVGLYSYFFLTHQ